MSCPVYCFCQKDFYAINGETLRYYEKFRDVYIS